jgi:hypothetical protein
MNGCGHVHGNRGATNPVDQPDERAIDGSGIPRLYYIDEIAEAWNVEPLFLARRLRDGRFEGVKVGPRWAMTEVQLTAALETLSNKQQRQRREALESPNQYGGITRRSWQYRQRYGIEGNPNMQGSKPESTDGLTPCGAGGC